MAKLFYRTVNGDTEIDAYSDPQKRSIADLQAELALIVELEAFSPSLREKLAQGAVAFGISSGQFQNLPALDDYLEARRWQIEDLLDLPGYSKAPPVSFNVATDAFYLPEALELPLPDDNGVDVSARAIDAVGGGVPDPNDPEPSTYWQSEIAGVRSIVFRLRGHPKKVLGLRFRCANAADGRSQLQNMAIKMSRGLGQIDDPANVVEAGVDLVYPGSGTWISYTAPGTGVGQVRFIKLEIPSSLHSSPNHVRIRAVQAQVGITNHEN